MGGGHTLAATNNNPGTFAYIGLFSSGPRTIDETFQKQLDAVKAGGVKFYWLGAGTTDMAREGTVNLPEMVKKERGDRISAGTQIMRSRGMASRRDFLKVSAG